MKYFLYIFIFFSSVSYCQELNIETKSTKMCYVLSEPDYSSNTLIKLKKGKKCNINEYSGEGFWNLTYKDVTGFINSKCLEVNNDMKLSIREFDSLLIIRRDKELKLLSKIKENERLDSLKRKKNQKRKDSLRKIEISNAKKIELDKKRREIQEKKRVLMDERRNNCHYYKNEIDEFDNVKITTTEYYRIDDKSNLYIRLKNYNGNKTIFISLDSDLGCASSYTSNKSFVKFKLENDKIITFYHKGDIDCAEFTLIGRLTNNDIFHLTKSPIKSIRLSGTKYFEDVSDIYYPNYFIDKLDCIK